MAMYEFTWNDGKKERCEGSSVSDAFTKLGYGAEAMAALDYYQQVKVNTLDSLVKDWSVSEPGAWDNDQGPLGWYAVLNTEGIVAYFQNGADAFRFRLAEINRALNG